MWDIKVKHDLYTCTKNYSESKTNICGFSKRLRMLPKSKIKSDKKAQ